MLPPYQIQPRISFLSFSIQFTVIFIFPQRIFIENIVLGVEFPSSGRDWSRSSLENIEKKERLEGTRYSRQDVSGGEASFLSQQMVSLRAVCFVGTQAPWYPGFVGPPGTLGFRAPWAGWVPWYPGFVGPPGLEGLPDILGL